ncbi:MAG: NUDIX hydrolase [Caulobacteraceae bacterium]|jgi:8-oxo-dGTP diphosphatase
MTDFLGAKIALLCGDELVAYRRDDKPDIPFPGFWDLPGGGREGAESPLECAFRETEEEFGLRLSAGQVRWERFYTHASGLPPSWFFVAEIEPAQAASIVFGDEGQYWRMMAVREFLEMPDAPPNLQARLRQYLESIGGSSLTPATGFVP